VRGSSAAAALQSAPASRAAATKASFIRGFPGARFDLDEADSACTGNSIDVRMAAPKAVRAASSESAAK
jgi:hypothetical protein